MKIKFKLLTLLAFALLAFNACSVDELQTHEPQQVENLSKSSKSKQALQTRNPGRDIPAGAHRWCENIYYRINADADISWYYILPPTPRQDSPLGTTWWNVPPPLSISFGQAFDICNDSSNNAPGISGPSDNERSPCSSNGLISSETIGNCTYETFCFNGTQSSSVTCSDLNGDGGAVFIGDGHLGYIGISPPPPPPGYNEQ